MNLPLQFSKMATKNRLKVCSKSLTFVSILKSCTVQCSALTVRCTIFKMGSIVRKFHTAILHLPEAMRVFFNRHISFFFYYFNGELHKDSLNAKQYTAFSHTSQYERTLCTYALKIFSIYLVLKYVIWDTP